MHRPICLYVFVTLCQSYCVCLSHNGYLVQFYFLKLPIMMSLYSLTRFVKSTYARTHARTHTTRTQIPKWLQFSSWFNIFLEVHVCKFIWRCTVCMKYQSDIYCDILNLLLIMYVIVLMSDLFFKCYFVLSHLSTSIHCTYFTQ